MSDFRVFDQDGNAVPITANGDGSFSFIVPPGVTSLTVRDSHTINLGPARTVVIDERTDPPTVRPLVPGEDLGWGGGE